MTPEQIVVLRKHADSLRANHCDRLATYVDMSADAAEREANLREALDNMADLWLTVGGTEDNPVYADAVAALEQKGGASDDT